MGLQCPLSLLKCGCGRGTWDSPYRRLCDAYLYFIRVISLNRLLFTAYAYSLLSLPGLRVLALLPIIDLIINFLWKSRYNQIFWLGKIFFSPSNRPFFPFLPGGLSCLGDYWGGVLVNPFLSPTKEVQ